MNPSRMNNPRLLLSLFCLSLLAPVVEGAERFNLNNGEVAAEFNDTGLVQLTLLKSQQTLAIAGDSAWLTVDGEKLAVPGLKLTATKRRQESVTYTYVAGDKQLQVVYELKPGWQFVSKQLLLTLPGGTTSRVDAVEMLRATLQSPVAREHRASSASGAVFLRLGETHPPPKSGLFLALQNPFLKWERQGQQVAMSYAPDSNGARTTGRSPPIASASASTRSAARNSPLATSANGNTCPIRTGPSKASRCSTRPSATP